MDKCPFCREYPMNYDIIATRVLKVFTNHVLWLAMSSIDLPDKDILTDTLHIIFKKFVYYKYNWETLLEVAIRAESICSLKLEGYKQYQMDADNTYNNTCNIVILYSKNLLYM